LALLARFRYNCTRLIGQLILAILLMFFSWYHGPTIFEEGGIAPTYCYLEPRLVILRMRRRKLNHTCPLGVRNNTVFPATDAHLHKYCGYFLHPIWWPDLRILANKMMHPKSMMVHRNGATKYAENDSLGKIKDVRNAITKLDVTVIKSASISK